MFSLRVSAWTSNSRSPRADSPFRLRGFARLSKDRSVNFSCNPACGTGPGGGVSRPVDRVLVASTPSGGPIRRLPAWLPVAGNASVLHHFSNVKALVRELRSPHST